MKKLFISFALLIFAFSVDSFAQQPKTVTDFYLAMPSDVYSTNNEGNKVTGKAALTKLRKSLIKVEDIKNGYLKLEGAWEGWAEIALFKKKDGNYLIAQAESGCGPACEGFVKFFTYKAGKWTDVTNQVFPNLSEAQVKQAFASKKVDLEDEGMSYYFLLPQVGTTVKMACNMCENGETSESPDLVLMEFTWNGEKFSIKK